LRNVARTRVLLVLQGGAHGFVIVGDADDGPGPLPSANGGGGGGTSLGDDDLPPDFDAMPMEAFESKPVVVAGGDAAAAPPAAAVDTMEVD